MLTTYNPGLSDDVYILLITLKMKFKEQRVEAKFPSRFL